MTEKTEPSAAVKRMMAPAPSASDIDMSIGEPDQKAPKAIVDATAQALQDGTTGYTAKAGILELREALAAEMQECTGILPNVEDVTVTVGGSEAVAVAILAVCSKEVPIAIPDPAWPNYKVISDELEIPVQRYGQGPSGDDFFDINGVEKALQAGAKLVVVCSPSNPTAAVASREALKQLPALLEKYDAYALSDEAYESIVFGGGRAPSLYEFAPERTFVTRTFSKTFSMTGFRIGSLVTPAKYHDAVAALHGTVTGCASSFAQQGALVAIRDLPERGQEMAEIYSARFKNAAEVLGDWMPPVDVMSLGGLYLWIDGRPAGLTSDDLVDAMRSRGVLVSSGLVYTDDDGFIRLSLGTPDDQLEVALAQLREVLDAGKAANN